MCNRNFTVKKPENRDIFTNDYDIWCNRNEMFYLRMNNSSIEIPKIRNGRFLSTKDGDAHGYGIENVKTIIENYQGSLEFQYDENRFEVTVLI